MPPTDPAGVANIGSTKHRALAREAARQGLTLLLNRHPTTGGPPLGCITSAAATSAEACPTHGEVVCPVVAGCKADGDSGGKGQATRILPHCVASGRKGNGHVDNNCPNGTVVTNLTLGGCAQLCAEKGFDRAGAEDGHECWCGHGSSADSAPASKACTATCPGNNAQKCGGNNALTLMKLSCQAHETSAPPAPLPANMSAVKNVAVIGQLGESFLQNQTRFPSNPAHSALDAVVDASVGRFRGLWRRQLVRLRRQGFDARGLHGRPDFRCWRSSRLDRGSLPRPRVQHDVGARDRCNWCPKCGGGCARHCSCGRARVIHRPGRRHSWLRRVHLL